jgi:4-amino-4-deoxy-L-arabinose transferase-like glycosyltransferase
LTRTAWLLLVLFLAVLLLFRLGGRGLNEPDEGRYANIGREMLEPEHAWWDPQLSDLGHYDKPPLIYWAAALSFHVFGQDETAARLPSAFGAFLALAGTGWLAWRLYGGRTAWLAVLVCGTLAQFWLLARFLTPDMLLAGWCGLAAGAWAECRHRNGHWGWWGAQLFFWTLAWWTKATPALVPLAGMLAACLFMRDGAGMRALRPGRLVLGILALGSPWFLLAMREHPSLVDFFLHRELAGRVAGHADGRQGPAYYYLLVSLAAWLPWWPAALAGFRRRYWKDGREAAGWEGAVAVAGILFFSAISSKLPTYTLTLAPWVAVLFARWLLAALGGALFPVRPRLAWPVLGSALGYLLLASAAPGFQSSLGRNSSLSDVAAWIRRHPEEGGVIADHYWPGLEFYLGENVRYTNTRPPVELGEQAEEAREHFLDKEKLGEAVRGRVAWLVHYRKEDRSPLLPLKASGTVLETREVGDFELWRVRGG